MPNKNNDFSKEIFNFSKQVESDTASFVKKTAVKLNEVLVFETPKRTGRAAGNWIVGIDNQKSNKYYVNLTDTSKKEQIAQSAIERNNKDISKFSSQNSTINITNNLDYIHNLNDGSSAQAAENYVEDAVTLVTDYMRGLKF